jgi:hypothetical protein
LRSVPPNKFMTLSKYQHPATPHCRSYGHACYDYAAMNMHQRQVLQQPRHQVQRHKVQRKVTCVCLFSNATRCTPRLGEAFQGGLHTCSRVMVGRDRTWFRQISILTTGSASHQLTTSLNVHSNFNQCPSMPCAARGATAARWRGTAG